MITNFNVELAIEKINAALSQVAHLKSVDFPYHQPMAALAAIEALFNADLRRLENLQDFLDEGVIRGACHEANEDLAKYHKVLGFILRSTNVRNAFEVYEPLLRLCRDVCGHDTRLILSSEWSFSPFTFPPIFDELRNIIFIGLPATESQNPLILPLAGHELGHSVWRLVRDNFPRIENSVSRQIEFVLHDNFKARWDDYKRVFEVSFPIEDLIPKTANRPSWSRTRWLCKRHSEELFCDILGLRLFGESFLYAFLYLISPHLGNRQPHYPQLASRVALLIAVANKYEIDIPDRFAESFDEPGPDLTPRERFLVDIADATTHKMFDFIIKQVDNVFAVTGVHRPNNIERDRVIEAFKALSPAVGIVSFVSVINAAWAIKVDKKTWHEHEFSDKRRREVLSDITLKTIELIEFDHRVNRNA